MLLMYHTNVHYLFKRQVLLVGKCIKVVGLEEKKGGSSAGRISQSLGNAALNRQQGICSTLSGSFRLIVRLLHVRNFTFLFEA